MYGEWSLATLLSISCALLLFYIGRGFSSRWCIVEFCWKVDDCATENAPDNVRQWLQLIGDENSLSSGDFLYSSDTTSCPESSAVSTSNTLHTQAEVESMATAECLKESVSGDAAAGDKNLTESLRDDIQQFTLSHSVYKELAPLGNCIITPLPQLAHSKLTLFVYY